ncbi:hypothetical protein C5167_037321 [Papaver somniferum]|uniref:Uncharacterized protein n=1 Tax=Papaver somniferum TaxID=3469 RepID=A0A4Y7I601_PAPSO|nr:hypothetical protein C5167_037321 [Papaver somniferum]
MSSPGKNSKKHEAALFYLIKECRPNNNHSILKLQQSHKKLICSVLPQDNGWWRLTSENMLFGEAIVSKYGSTGLDMETKEDQRSVSNAAIKGRLKKCATSKVHSYFEPVYFSSAQDNYTVEDVKNMSRINTTTFLLMVPSFRSYVNGSLQLVWYRDSYFLTAAHSMPVALLYNSSKEIYKESVLHFYFYPFEKGNKEVALQR